MGVCARCNQPNPEAARFCMSCGAAIGPGAREERKLVSVVFVDIVGFTSRAEKLDVEDLRATLKPFFAMVRGELERYGGRVEKYIGDAVVAVYGAPAAHEDDAERAVRAALAIRDAIAGLNEREGLDLHVRIGVNTGEALVALDQPDPGEGMVTGDMVNVASRLQTGAPVDGVLVGESTERATAGSIEYGPPLDVAAKGKAEPVRAYEAQRPRSRMGVAKDARATGPLVGRVRERQLLIDRYAACLDERSPAMVLLCGGPGIGKSRLVQELFSEVEARPELVRWRQGRALPFGESATCAALADTVKAEAGILDTDGEDVAGSRLRAATAGLFGTDEAAWVESHLRVLVGLDRRADLRGDRRAEAFAAWRRFVEAMAGDRGLVLVLDDVHWADDALLDFVEHLLSWSSDVPLLVVCTARPELLERRPDLPALPNVTLVELQPLAEGEIGELIDALSGSALPAETRSQLLWASAGNPLFAREFLRMLINQGRLVAEDGRWTLTGSGDMPVPDSLLAIISARLDALPAEDKTVLQDAAVVGRVFWPGAVAAVADRGRWAIAETMRRLERRELVRRRRDSAVEGDAEYIFQHALVRDVAYGSILRPERAAKHLRAANWLQGLSGGMHDRAEALAHHYLTAIDLAGGAPLGPGAAERAAEALGTAGQRALALHAYPAAARSFAQALELAPAGAPAEATYQLGRGLALAMAGEPAGEALDRAADLLAAQGEPERAAEAESARAWLEALAGRMDEARACDERALALVHDRPASASQAVVLSRAGTHRVFAPELHDVGLEMLEQALTIARAQGLREVEAEALQFAGMGRIAAGDVEGVGDVERALAIAVDLGSPVALSAYGNLADLRKRLGALGEAAALHEAGLQSARRFGIPWQVRRFRAERMAHLYWSERWDEALDAANEYLEAVEHGSPHEMEGEVRVLRGRIRHAQGDEGSARDDAELAVRFGRQTGHPYDLYPALALAGKLGDRDATGELLVRLADAQLLWAAWALPDAVGAAAAAGREHDLRSAIDGSLPETPWSRAALRSTDGDHAGAAAIYDAMGARPEAAEARRAAGLSRAV